MAFTVDLQVDDAVWEKKEPEVEVVASKPAIESPVSPVPPPQCHMPACPVPPPCEFDYQDATVFLAFGLGAAVGALLVLAFSSPVICEEE